MNHLKIDNKDLYIIDNLFSSSYQAKLYGYVTKLNNYGIGFEDTDQLERLQHKYYVADFNVDHLSNTKLFDEIDKTRLKDLIKDKQLYRATINTSVPTQTNYPHCHHGEWSLIYYLNADWRPEWGGETLFYNDNMTEIEYASIYKPNRAIFFDGDIPHSLRTQSITAPHYRFSLAMFFDK